eukprot:Blabericola_migrator_1__7929@NODE_4062_length_1353_cov_55_405910_g2508_i0_p1_GENE_NODE_4062_length_1353_cov_55_405910_g2508_i0NODE_4062_length_1353_cov_55_405910_g2508_i0_p1_ORF_typecomplete_len137_score5_20DUF3440/PF11922_8/0_18_NODE_4062_length_1353_cov_55_405910_g2508_i0574984
MGCKTLPLSRTTSRKTTYILGNMRLLTRTRIWSSTVMVKPHTGSGASEPTHGNQWWHITNVSGARRICVRLITRDFRCIATGLKSRAINLTQIRRAPNGAFMSSVCVVMYQCSRVYVVATKNASEDMASNVRVPHA